MERFLLPSLSLSLLLLLYLAATELCVAAPPETTSQPHQLVEMVSLPGREDEVEVMDSASYSEAIPAHDFTLENISSTVDEILAQAHPSLQTAPDPVTRTKRRPCACTTTIGAYGSTHGTAFVDVPTNACDVEITDIWIGHGTIIDSIQIRYNFSDGHQETMPRRGGGGGTPTHVSVPEGGKIMGFFGGIVNNPGIDGLQISHLRILVLDAQEHLQIYGPFGSHLFINPSSFAVYGDIKSIFGYYRRSSNSNVYLSALGVYYEPWGVCGSPCAVGTQPTEGDSE